jgi:FkbM family methyltransferase
MLDFAFFQKALKMPKILLISRGLFKNWLTASLRYFLNIRGLVKNGIINVKCKDGSVVPLPTRLYGLLLEGLSNGLFEQLRIKEKVVVVKGIEIPFQELLASECILDALDKGWSYDKTCGWWSKDDVKFRHMRYYILEVFDHDEHKDIDVYDKTVVDIGAGYGETAIYFLKRGARQVIAVEPCPKVFKEMVENLRLNEVEDRVIPINAAISGTRRVTSVECPGERATANVITLGDLARRYDLRGGVLKMDCEGCEYDVILNDYEHVRLFDEVYFEYHAFITKKPVELLLKRLSEDFVCKIVSDEDFYRRHGFNEKLLGLVKCVKK